MPATEAAVATDEQSHYEFAFHVLPTVAEGEVRTVFDEIKTMITTAGGSVTTEEAPKRIDLAYEIVKPIEGKNRKFGSAYFGWIRFTLAPAALAELTEDLEAMSKLLRSLTVKLTRVEEENPFFYHEALAAEKKVDVVGDDAEAATEAEDDTDDSATDEAVDEADEKAEDEADTK